MKGKWVKPFAIASAIAFAGTCVACAPHVATEKTSASASDSQASGAIVQTKDTSWEQWQSEYPNEVGSFFEGMTEVESWDGKVHSHAMLFANTPQLKNGVEKFGSACIACKSTTGTKLLNEQGLAAFSLPWDQISESVDWYDCQLCHEDGTPGAPLKYDGMAATEFGSTLLDSIDPKQAVCGQCHNFYGAVYTRGGLMEKMQSGEVDVNSVDPYRYGTDPDSLLKAALEDGYELVTDQETGLQTLQANHPEIEIFQGSVHEQLGMACVDCHSAKETDENGNEYQSHDFSSSPLEHEESLEYCLTCHSSQGIETTDQMKDFVHNAQQEVADLEATFYEKQATLKDLVASAVKNGDVDEATLDKARENYTRGTWYVRYSDGGGDFKGMKVAHNPEAEKSYVQRATVLMDEAIAMLS